MNANASTTYDIMINSAKFDDNDDSDNNIENSQLMTEAFAVVFNPEDPGQLYQSIHFIINNLSILDKSDAIELSEPLFHYALDFDQIQVAAISLHLLSIFKETFSENFEGPISQFTNDAILQAEFIGQLCLQEFNEVTIDLIGTYILFSPKMFIASIEHGIIDQIITKRPFVEDSGQTLFHLLLIFRITKSKKLNKKDELLKQIYTKAFEPILNFESLRTTEVVELVIKILSALFECEFEKEQNVKNLFEDYCQKYLVVLQEQSANCLPFFLNILNQVSQYSFIKEFISKYSLYNYIIPFLNESEENPLIDLELMKLSWQILSNFIEDNVEQMLYVFENHIVEISAQICVDGTIQMKGFVINFILNIIKFSIDWNNPPILQRIRDIGLISNLLQIIDNIDLDSARLIIGSIYHLYSYLKTADRERYENLREDLNLLDVHNALTQWLENYDFQDKYRKWSEDLLSFIDYEDSSSDDDES